MKKQIIKIAFGLFLLSSGTSLVSCRKQLDEDPSNAVRTNNTFKSIDDFEQNAKGMYSQMVRAEHYIGGSDESISWISSMDLMADNLITQQTGRGSQRAYSRWLYIPTNAYPTFAECYSIIRAANAIIENKDKVEGTEPYYGEALAVRAMVHFDLLRLYSKPVSGPQAAPASLGVPYVTTTDIQDKPSRPTVKETYDKIVDDLKLSLDYINTNNGVGRLNKTAVYGLLSRVYLYGGEWQKCIDASTDCLAANNNPGAIDKFPDIWTDVTNDGVLFKVRFTQQDLGVDGVIRIGVAYNQISGAGYRNEWVATKSLFDLFRDEDVRKSSYLETAPFSGVEYNAVIKYLTKGDQQTPPTIVDVKYLRVAEILLNRAEAYATLNQDGLALDDLDALRSERYSDFTAGTESGQALKDAIQLERRLELAFESDRWFTLKRLGLPVQRDNFGDYADGTGTPTPAPFLGADDYRWQLPLTQYDLQANPNLQQNPNY